MKKLIKTLFGETCSLWFCFKKPWKYLRLSMEGLNKNIPFCEDHAKIADEVIANKEIDVDVPYSYTPIKKCFRCNDNGCPECELNGINWNIKD